MSRSRPRNLDPWETWYADSPTLYRSAVDYPTNLNVRWADGWGNYESFDTFGGLKRGLSYGTADELGYAAVENVVSVHDLHATMLHLLEIAHARYSSLLRTIFSSASAWSAQ